VEGIVIVHFNDDGVLAFTVEAFEETKVKGLVGVKYYEHWLDKKEAKKIYRWLV
jgi:gamma-glutamyl-gamma-aminobutyrate hydrolase PuuD